MNSKDYGIVKNVIISVVCLVVVIIMMKDAKYIFTGEAKDINQMIENGEELKVGEHVSIEVTYVVDWYAELTQRGKRTGTKITYHALAVLDSGEIISLSAKKDSKEYNQIDKLVDDTFDYLMDDSCPEPTTVKFTGTVRKVDSEIIGYYREALSYYGYSSTGDAYMFDIDTSQKRIVSILLLGIAAFLAILFGILAFLGYREYKKDKEARIKALNEPVNNKLENDPIFKNLYARNNIQNDLDSNLNTESTEVENSEVEVETPDNTTYSSKFSLKKD